MPWHQRWRWDEGKHLKPTVATIMVSEPSDEQKAERERKIEEGAEVVPFGFGRVIAARPQEPEPEAWEGMGL